MTPILCLSNLTRLEAIKTEIKSLLIAKCNENITLHQLCILYKDVIGYDIPFKDFNYTSLKEFLASIPDTVSFSFDKNNKLYVHHVESDKTKHLSSLIIRQKSNKRSKKSEYKLLLQSNFIDPVVLKKVLLKLSCSSKKKNNSFRKVDVLSEVKSVIGPHCFYTIHDLNVQLNELTHILVHDDEYIYMKMERKSIRENPLDNFIKKTTKDRLQKLAEKYPDGIWCADLPNVYRSEYGIDLEYINLGFYNIVEFVAALPKIFSIIKPPNTSKHKVISTKISVDCLINQTDTDCVQKTDCAADDFCALPAHSVSKMLIPKEYMNLDDSIEQINVGSLFENLDTSIDVIITEVYNPSMFWIILRKNKRNLIKLMDNLQEFYTREDLDSYRIPPIILKPGLHIACIFYSQWHRGIIKSVKSNSLTILFYDYGTVKTYKADEIYFLHKTFSSVPAQAIPCSLHNVKPIASKKWSNIIIEKFTDKTIEKHFVAFVFSINQENMSLVVELIDTNKATEEHITEWMVSKKLAIWGNYIFEKNNFTLKQDNEYLRKTRNNSVKNLQDLNKIDLNEKIIHNSSYVRPAKQLEALKKYKTRFKLLEILSVTHSKNIIIERQNKLVSNSLDKFDKDKTENLKFDLKKNQDSNKRIMSFNNQSKDKFTNVAINDDDTYNARDTKEQKFTKKNIEDAVKELQKLMSCTKL